MLQGLINTSVAKVISGPFGGVGASSPVSLAHTRMRAHTYATPAGCPWRGSHHQPPALARSRGRGGTIGGGGVGVTIELPLEGLTSVEGTTTQPILPGILAGSGIVGSLDPFRRRSSSPERALSLLPRASYNSAGIVRPNH